MCDATPPSAPSPLGVLLKANDQTKDFTIATLDGEIRVHKAVLSVSSEFFCKCIQYSHRDCLEVPDSGSVWKAAVGFMYERTVDGVGFHDLLGLVRVGCEYLIRELMFASTQRVAYLIRNNLVQPAEDVVVAMTVGVPST